MGMKTSNSLVAMVAAPLLVAVGAAPVSARCGDKAGHRNPVETTLTLNVIRPRPAYYLRTSAYVMMFTADDMIKRVEESDRNGRHAALLSALKRDQPLASDTDLFKYAFELPREVETLDYAVAALLDEGKANLTATSALDGSGPSETTIVRGSTVFDGITYSRAYCTATGTQLHRVQDTYE
jgi:hypothetical protein